MTDEDRVAAAMAGDDESVRALTERYGARIHAFIAALSGHAQDTEDICQDVFLAVFTHLQNFDGRRGSFASWIYAIARNRCRRLGRQRIAVFDLPRLRDSRAPDDDLATRELHGRLDAALAQLTFSQRSAFLLAEIEGLAYEEIATVEGGPHRNRQVTPQSSQATAATRTRR